MELGLRKWGNHLGLQIPHQLAVSWGLDETSVVEIVEIEEGLLIRKKSSPPSLDALLATIPPDFTYPDDVADFVRNEPKGNELL
jgi:antitoxin MazE